MEKFVTGIGIAVIAMVLIAFAALIGGTILWLIWPVAIPAAFPGAVASGAVAAELSWWASVCLVWLSNILIKTTVTQKTKD